MNNLDYVRRCRSKLSDEKKKYLNQYYCRSWKSWIGRYTSMCIIEDKSKGRFSDVNSDYIMDLLISQDYKCALTGVGLRHDKSLWSLSIDRVDNSLGHVMGNVQLVCRAVNLAKNRHSNKDVIELLSNFVDPTFDPGPVISRDYVSTMIRNHKQRDLGRGYDFDIDTDYILDFYGENNKCYLSGIKLAVYRHPMFGLSIDRIDNSLGHVTSNVQLVCRAVNLAKRDYSDFEFANWLFDIRECLGKG